MNVSPSKENILKKIRQALSESTPLPFPQAEGNASVFQPPVQEMEVQFAEHFTGLGGKFVYCINHQELASYLNNLANQQKWTKVFCRETELKAVLQKNLFDNFCTSPLGDCDAAITTCELLVARTGSMVLSAAQESGRTVSVYAPIHICIAYTHQLVYDVKDALQAIAKKYGDKLPSFISFATGPSRTADIEKTLVVGVHGPKEVYCFLVDE
ncbi:MAG: LUD domain-containing protein [Chitinophagaceae bacterium]